MVVLTPPNKILYYTVGAEELEQGQQSQMIALALSYPPRVRALLGAIMEDIKCKIDLSRLKESLNPLTKFELGIPDTILKTVSNWNIL